MKHFRRLVAVGLGACSFAVALGASAQSGKRTSAPSGASTYDFEPDGLVGQTLATTPPLLRIRPKPLRVMLLRPRASFVAEMLSSVDVI